LIKSDIYFALMIGKLPRTFTRRNILSKPDAQMHSIPAPSADAHSRFWLPGYNSIVVFQLPYFNYNNDE